VIRRTFAQINPRVSKSPMPLPRKKKVARVTAKKIKIPSPIIKISFLLEKYCLNSRIIVVSLG
jgi:hypothetical protein